MGYENAFLLMLISLIYNRPHLCDTFPSTAVENQDKVILVIKLNRADVQKHRYSFILQTAKNNYYGLMFH